MQFSNLWMSSGSVWEEYRAKIVSLMIVKAASVSPDLAIIDVSGKVKNPVGIERRKAFAYSLLSVF